MSLPQIQYQLSGRPVLLAGGTWALLNRRPIATACRPIAFAAFTNPLDVSDPRVIGGNLIFSVSTSRDAFLGHEPVSPLPSDADQKATGEFAGVGQSFSDLRKAPADGRSR